MKYQRSVLGFVWTLVNPLLTVTVLAIVFTHVVRITMPHYLAFLLSGYFAWNFMLQTISAGAFMLTEHAQLCRSVAFPKEVPILAAVASKLVEFAVEMGFVLVVLVFFHHHGLPASLLWLPWLLALQVLLALGVAFPLAAAAVFYQDIQHMIPILLTTLFYVTPVFYPASMVPESIRTCYMLNPLAQLLTAYHRIVYEGRVPSAALVGTLTLVSCMVAWVGYAVFNRYKADVAEVI